MCVCVCVYVCMLYILISRGLVPGLSLILCMCVCVCVCVCVCSGSPPAVQLSGLSEGRHKLKITPVGCASGSKTLSPTFTT